MEELRERKERMIKLSKRLRTAREYQSSMYSKDSHSLKNIKTKKTYYTLEGNNKVIQKFYPQSTTNKENKPIDIEGALATNSSGRNSKAHQPK